MLLAANRLINLYPVDSTVNLVNSYLLDSDLSFGQLYYASSNWANKVNRVAEDVFIAVPYDATKQKPPLPSLY